MLASESYEFVREKGEGHLFVGSGIQNQYAFMLLIHYA